MTMHLTELKQKPVSELMDMAREMSIDNVGRSRKQEVIAAIVRKQAKSGEDIYGRHPGDPAGWIWLSKIARQLLSRWPR